MFFGCVGLSGSTISEDLFYYNNNVVTYAQAFYGCRNLILPTRLFNLSNINKVVSFNQFMYAASPTYSFSGTTQDIWNYSGSSVIRTQAFYNQTALTNYASIPAAWK